MILEEFKQILNKLIVEEIEEASIEQVIPPELQQYLGRSDTFIRLSGSDKFKINPNYNQGDISPKGFYGFPFTKKELATCLKSGFGDRSSKQYGYILVFQIKGPILKISEYTSEMLKADLTKLKLPYPEDIEDIGPKSENGVRVIPPGARTPHVVPYNYKNPFKTLWDVLDYKSENTDTSSKAYMYKAEDWQKKLIKLGYTAIFDDAKSKIHNDIPYQIFVLKNNLIQQLAVVKNPFQYGK